MQKGIWLIDHQAILGNNSPLNLDGSEWILGVCVLSADTKEQAIAKLGQYFKENDLTLQEVYEAAQYRPEDYTDESPRSEQINYAARKVLADGESCYVYARTSETIKSMQEKFKCFDAAGN